jgi:hypothetical protein
MATLTQTHSGESRNCKPNKRTFIRSPEDLATSCRKSVQRIEWRMARQFFSRA